jgi:electron transport complex protein RnfC
MGQRIGEASAFVSCHIHSSVSGKVLDVISMPDQLGRYVQHVVIENDGEDEKDFLNPVSEPLSLSSEEIKNLTKEAGLAGMGGATFPTFVKLSPPAESKFDTFILNGAECEPYLTSDHRLMLEKTEAVVIGTAMFKKAANATNAWIGIEKNKPRCH